MGAAFFYGSLCHAPLLAAVLGRAVETRRAILPGHRVVWARAAAFAIAVPDVDAQAQGLIATDLSPTDLARLAYYETGFVPVIAEVFVLDGAPGGQAASAWIYRPAPDMWHPGDPWDLAVWAARFSKAAVAAAPVFMRDFGRRPGAEALARYPQMLDAAAARDRAGTPAPALLRRAAVPGDVQVQGVTEGYQGFFTVEDYHLRHRRFDGAMGPVLARAAFVSCDAAVVLPWDPSDDRVLVIEQFRMGPYARGDANPWLIEAIAGRVDAGETPETCARREALEEAGVTLGPLVALPPHYPSPGAKSEFIYPFIAPLDLSAPRAPAGGMATEGEDIRTHLIDRAHLMDLVAAGEAVAGPLLTAALWLSVHADRLRLEFAAPRA